MICRAISIKGYGCKNESIWKGLCQRHAKLHPETKLPQRKTFYLRSDSLDLNEIKEYFLTKGFPCELIDLDSTAELETAYLLVIRGGLRLYSKIREFENNISLIQNKLKEDLNIKATETPESEATIRIHLGSPDLVALRWYRKIRSPILVEIYNGDISFLFLPKTLKLVVKSISER